MLTTAAAPKPPAAPASSSSAGCAPPHSSASSLPPPALVFAITKAGDSIQLTDEEFAQIFPCKLVRNALPPNLEKQLLNDMQQRQRSEGFKRGKYYIGGQCLDVPRTSKYFILDEGEGLEDDLLSLRAPDSLRAASEILEAEVDSEVASQPDLPVDDLDRRGFSVSFCHAHFYKDGDEHMSTDTDRLTMIGPMPIIPSFSMGATRTLRITWIEAHLGDGASPLTQWTAVDVQLEHNSLLIMLPPMQERFWHELVPSNSVVPHPASGVGRFNITFRRIAPQWAHHAPVCKCGDGAVLRAARCKAGTQQRYYWECDTTLHPKCTFYERVENA